MKSTDVVIMRRPCVMEDEGRTFLIKGPLPQAEADAWIDAQEGEYFGPSAYYTARPVMEDEDEIEENPLFNPENPKAVYNMVNALWQCYSHNELDKYLAHHRVHFHGTDDKDLIELAKNILRRYEDFS